MPPKRVLDIFHVIYHIRSLAVDWIVATCMRGSFVESCFAWYPGKLNRCDFIRPVYILYFRLDRARANFDMEGPSRTVKIDRR